MCFILGTMEIKRKPIRLVMYIENNERIYNKLYLVAGIDIDGLEVFIRMVPEKNKSRAIGLAMFKENNKRSYDNQLQRSKLHFSVKEIKSEPGRESDFPIIGRLNY